MCVCVCVISIELELKCKANRTAQFFLSPYVSLACIVIWRFNKFNTMQRLLDSFVIVILLTTRGIKHRYYFFLVLILFIYE